MIFPTLNTTHLLLEYRYLILFPLVVIEGPVVTIITGSLATVGIFSLLLAYPIIVIADLVGDSLYYAIGRWGRETFIKKYGKLLRLDERRIKKIEDHFDNHSEKTLVFGKVTTLGSALLVVAGMSKMKYSKFIWINFLATIPKSLILLLVGYYFSKTVITINHYFNFVGIVIFLVVLLPFAGYVISRIIKSKKGKAIK